MSRVVAFRWGGHRHEASTEFRDGRVAVEREGSRAETEYAREGSTIVLRDSAGAESRVACARDARGLWLAVRGRTWLLVPESRHAGARGAAVASDEIRAPMPGRVVSVEARPGMAAAEGDLLLTIEAMKMEFRLTAPEDGTVLEVSCAPGDRVELGQLLVRLRPAEAEGGAI